MLSTLASIGEGVITTDLELAITFINTTAALLTGWTAEDAVGRPVEEVFRLKNTAGETVHLPFVKPDRGSPSSSSSKGLKRNTQLLDKAGGLKYVSANISEIRDGGESCTGYVLVFRDISRLRQMEEELLNERNNLKLFFDHAPMGMVIVNRQLAVLQFNEQVSKMLPGVNPDISRLGELFRCRCQGGLLSPLEESCPTCRLKERLLTVLDSGQPDKGFELPLSPAAGVEQRDVWFRISAVPLTMEEGRVVMLTLEDMTERKRAEEAINRAKEMAEAANKAKGQFLANMSHEIRTPLNGMLGMIDLTLQKELSWEQQENLSIAKTCAESLLKVINDILDFSKIEAGKLRIDQVEFDIRNLMEKSLKPHQRLAQEKGVSLRYAVYSDVPGIVLGDPQRLQQIIMNLVSNAVKFTETGSVEVRVQKQSGTEDEATLLFEVIDTGIGISDKEQELLFQSFSQVDGSYTRKYGGTGLGLAISKQLVEMMGGTIWVEGAKGKGATFSFTCKFSLYDPILSSLKSAQITSTLDKKLSILLVEDDKVNQLVTYRFLRDFGHRVVIANHGAEALELLQEQPFDLVLMDIQMPVMDGLTATRRIRARETGGGSRLPVIALTAHALFEERSKFIEAGLDDCVFKPVNMQELMRAIEAAVASATPAVQVEGLSLREPPVPESYLNRLELQRELPQWLAELQDSADRMDSNKVDQRAGRIKEWAIQAEADGIKNTAFRLQLAARKGDGPRVKELLQELANLLEGIGLTGG